MPLKDETCFDAEEHIRPLDFVLSVYDETMDNMIFLIADNCATNKSIPENPGERLLFSHLIV